MSVKPSFFDVTIGPEHPPGSLAIVVTPDGDHIETRLPNINVKAGDVVQFFIDGGGLGHRVQRNRRSSTASAGRRSSAGGRSSEEGSVTDELLDWCQEETRGVPNVFIANFSGSFGDGLAILALMRHAFPREIPPSTFAGSGTDAAANWDLAFRLATRIDCPQLLDSEDIASCRGQPDARSVVTYLLHLRRKLKAYLDGDAAAPASAPAKAAAPKAAPTAPAAAAAEPRFRPGTAGRKPPSLDAAITPSLSRLPIHAAQRESDHAVQASPAPAVPAVAKAATPAPAAASVAKATPPAAAAAGPTVPTLAVAAAAAPGRRWGEQPKPHESRGMLMARSSREQLEAKQAEGAEEQPQQPRTVSFPARSPRGPPPRPQTAAPTPPAAPAPSRPATAGFGASKPPPPPNQRRPFDWPGEAPAPAATPAPVAAAAAAGAAPRAAVPVAAAASRVPPPAAPRANFVPPPAGVPVAGDAGLVQRTQSLQPKKATAFGTNSSRRPPPRRPFDWPADAPWPPVVGVSS